VDQLRVQNSQLFVGQESTEDSHMTASPSPQAQAQQAQGLTEAKIEQGWRDTFSTSNPFCPCNLKTFTKAARWAERELRASTAAAPSPVPAGWIRVDDKLPEFNTEVLVVFAGPILPATGQLSRIYGKPGETEWLVPKENSGFGEDYTVTHWMPLPLHPREVAAAPGAPTPAPKGTE
jgi:hypothetical protein